MTEYDIKCYNVKTNYKNRPETNPLVLELCDELLLLDHLGQFTREDMMPRVKRIFDLFAKYGYVKNNNNNDNKT